MRSIRRLLPRCLIVLALLALAACGAGTSSTGQTTGGTSTAMATAKATPQPTAKPAPMTAPQVSQQWCQSAMTVAQASQCMNPSAPATTLEVHSSPGEQGVWRYTSAGAQFPVVSIIMDYKVYTGPKPVPEATIEQTVAQLAGAPNVTLTSLAAVSGVGGQAEFLAAKVSEQARLLTRTRSM
jgi:hypothetical protein